jgi:hypothetical protein
MNRDGYFSRRGEQAWGKNPMVIGLFRVQDTQFLSRTTAIALRRLAEEDPDPDTAAELRYVAQLPEAEAEDPTRRDAE